MKDSSDSVVIKKQKIQQECQFQRVPVTLFGRYMLKNQREFPCKIKDISPGDVLLFTHNPGVVGEKVIAYIDHIGRLEGEITSVLPDSFTMSINATEKKRNKIAARLTWIANRHELNLQENRCHERMTSVIHSAPVKFENGQSCNATIMDLSVSGAAIKIDVRPAVGTLLWLGTIRSRVVRHFDEGIAIEFVGIQDRSALNPFLQED